MTKLNSPPDELLQRWQKILPPDAYLFMTEANRQMTTFRLNGLKQDPRLTRVSMRQAGFSLAAIEWYDRGHFVPREQRPTLVNSTFVREGFAYPQNASSFLPPLLLNPQPGETILDLAAAPGGKTIHLAELMNNEGRISAVEPISARFFRLRANLENAGVKIAKLYRTDGRGVGRKVPRRFDRTLLDAPCSAEARIRFDNPETWNYWSPRKIREQARKQKGLLKSAILATKSGGRILYCTCSLAPEENEAVVDWVIRQSEFGVHVEPIDWPVSDQYDPNSPSIATMPGLTAWEKRTFANELKRAWRVLPTITMDAFFICCLRKE